MIDMNAHADPLFNLLRPERLTSVVDIGANPLETAPPYKPMLDKRLCTVVGFEPQPEAMDKLIAQKGDLETYLPYAVGGETRATLKVCHAPGMTSLLTPEPRTLNCFPGFAIFGMVTKEIPIETRALDSIAEITHIDHLKIDVQGSELSIFRNGAAKLALATSIQTEVSFVPLYQGQPVFGDIDLALRALGFIPHMFADINKRMILPLHHADNLYSSMNQLLEADIVYVRDFTQAEKMTVEQLKHLALVAHHCYRSYDLTANCINHLATRGVLPADAVGRYLGDLKMAAAA
jgi:FkbM family methyltransferase